METKLARIAEISKERPKEVFTSVYHLINLELLMLVINFIVGRIIWICTKTQLLDKKILKNYWQIMEMIL